MGQADIRAVIARYNKAWADHDVDRIVALHSEDSVFENHTSGGKGTGLAEIRKIVGDVFATFPDIAFTARREYYGDDFACVEWTATATFVNPIIREGAHLIPTNERLTWNGVDVIPVVGGKIARKDVYVDSLTFLRQIGAR